MILMWGKFLLTDTTEFILLLYLIIIFVNLNIKIKL